MSTTTMTAERPGVRIVPPAEFPVRWAQPDDENLHWLQDRMHAPDPLLPLEQAKWTISYQSFNRASDSYAMPIHVEVRYLNSYLYMTGVPAAAPEAMEARDREFDARMDQAMGSLRRRWEEEWLPEIQAHLGRWDAVDLAAASPEALLAHVEETWTRLARMWEVHFEIVFPTYIVMSQFADLHQDLFADRGAFASYRLLQGFDNKTLEAGRALWQLSREARRSPEVMAALMAGDAATTLRQLQGSAAGREFAEGFHAYLRVYGLRSDTWGLSRPAWIEDPAPALKSLQGYLADPEGDPAREQAALAAERERAVAEAREGLRGYPRPIVERYEFLLAAAQAGVVLSEDHNFWIDFGVSYRVRRVMLECGRRLAASGVIGDAADVFFLTMDEVAAALRELPGGNRQSAVRERQAEVAWARTVTPPPALGTDAGAPPDNPTTRFFGKLFGQPPQPSTQAGVVRGSAGSPGTARGRARVVRSLAEAGKVQPGDVLVAPTTAPPWTPLFASVAAVVTDTGGVLSHCAVVAREYHLPAVVGTGRATAVILDGQLVEVDGDAGLVHIVAE